MGYHKPFRLGLNKLSMVLVIFGVNGIFAGGITGAEIIVDKAELLMDQHDKSAKGELPQLESMRWTTWKDIKEEWYWLNGWEYNPSTPETYRMSANGLPYIDACNNEINSNWTHAGPFTLEQEHEWASNRLKVYHSCVERVTGKTFPLPEAYTQKLLEERNRLSQITEDDGASQEQSSYESLTRNARATKGGTAAKQKPPASKPTQNKQKPSSSQPRDDKKQLEPEPFTPSNYKNRDQPKNISRTSGSMHQRRDESYNPQSSVGQSGIEVMPQGKQNKRDQGLKNQLKKVLHQKGIGKKARNVGKKAKNMKKPSVTDILSTCFGAFTSLVTAMWIGLKVVKRFCSKANGSKPSGPADPMRYNCNQFFNTHSVTLDRQAQSAISLSQSPNDPIVEFPEEFIV